MPDKVYLIGTMHGDVRGPRRLARALEVIKPDVVAVESYPSFTRKIIAQHERVLIYSNEEISRIVRGILGIEDFNLETARLWLQTRGYEVWVSAKYVKKNGISLENLEEYEVAKKEEKNAVSELGARKIKEVLTETARLTPLEYERLGDSFYEDFFKDRFQFRGNNISISQRNEIFAGKIKSFNGRVAAVTGLLHNHKVSPSLSELLSGLGPRVIDLPEVDYL